MRKWVIAMVVLMSSGAPAEMPDRPPRPSEWGYRPLDGSRVAVNPPSLTWVHDPAAAYYIVQWSTTPDFRDTVTVDKVRWCVYTYHAPLRVGTHFWRYRIIRKDGSVSEWSKVRRFTVPSDAAIFPQPS